MRKIKAWKGINAALASNESWKIVVLLRLSPIMPWPLLSYAMSVTNVPFQEYAVLSAVCSLPWVVLFTFMASLLGSYFYRSSLEDIFLVFS